MSILLGNYMDCFKTNNTNLFTRKVMHVKTGKIYYVIRFPDFGNIIECTNGREGLNYVLYTDGIRIYCREQEEFNQKFKNI